MGRQGKPPRTPRELEVTCPCCHNQLLVDARTGAVLREDRPKKPAKSFEAALDEERTRRASSDAAFGKALRSQKHHQDVLQRKFEEAMKKAAEEPDEKPPNPLDWD